MVSGRWPAQDHTGADFAPGSSRTTLTGHHLADLHDTHYTDAFVQMRSDLDNYSKEFRLAHHSFSSLCFRCRGNRSNLPWVGVPPTADWCQECYDSASLLAIGTHKTFVYPGVHMNTFGIDPTHTLDLGVTKDLLGSCFHYWVYEKRLNPAFTIEKNCDLLSRFCFGGGLLH